MSHLLHTWSRVAAGLRRTAARRPWIQWLVIVALAGSAAAVAHRRMAAIDAARDGWGDAVPVWVARGDAEVGEPLATTRAEAPRAMVPDGAVTFDPAGLVARQRIGPGEIVTTVDVMPLGDLASLTPDGWLVTPVDERPASGASAGERVRVVSGGFVLAEQGVVVGAIDHVTLVALPADVAPLVPAAAESGDVTLLRIP